MGGLEPPTSASRTQRSTILSHTPIYTWIPEGYSLSSSCFFRGDFGFPSDFDEVCPTSSGRSHAGMRLPFRRCAVVRRLFGLLLLRSIPKGHLLCSSECTLPDGRHAYLVH